MPNPSALTPGHHHFTSPTNALTFEYIIHHHHHHQAPPRSLLLIHSPAWGLGSRYLQAGLQALQTHTRALLFFHPRGTDNSTPAAQMSTTPHLASDLEDLRQHLGLDAFPALLGHSHGGAVVLAYAQMYPERVRSLVLLSHSLPGVEHRRVTERWVARDERYSEAVAVLRAAEPRSDVEFTEMVRRGWAVWFFDPARYVDVLKDAVGERVMSVGCWRSVYACDRGSADGRMVEGLGRVMARTLVVFGKDDLVCGPRIAEVTRKGIRDVVVLGYERCGHFPWIEREETLRDINAFLDSGEV